MTVTTPSLSLWEPLELPCGVVLSNRLAKAAMSDSLADGKGQPTPAQCRLYQRWATGGLGLSIIGEVQFSPDACEKPGNLVLNNNNAVSKAFEKLANITTGTSNQLWLQLGNAGALAFEPTSPSIKGPSALDLPELSCEALALEEIQNLPQAYATTAHLAQQTGFGGVEVHAAHGFLLSQFLSPLFNHRTDGYGIDNRSKLLLQVIEAVREAVGPSFPIGVKLNASDQLEGGLTTEDSLGVFRAIVGSTAKVDIIDISGGTYFPGAKAASDGASKSGPYFMDYAKQARQILQEEFGASTKLPALMLTGGFKTKEQAEQALQTVDLVGLARAVCLDPSLSNLWKRNEMIAPVFPRFQIKPPVGGITAWYSMRLTEIGEDREGKVEDATDDDLVEAIETYDKRDKARVDVWNAHFFVKKVNEELN